MEENFHNVEPAAHCSGQELLLLLAPLPPALQPLLALLAMPSLLLLWLSLTNALQHCVEALLESYLSHREERAAKRLIRRRCPSFRSAGLALLQQSLQRHSSLGWALAATIYLPLLWLLPPAMLALLLLCSMPEVFGTLLSLLPGLATGLRYQPGYLPHHPLTSPLPLALHYWLLLLLQWLLTLKDPRPALESTGLLEAAPTLLAGLALGTMLGVPEAMEELEALGTPDAPPAPEPSKELRSLQRGLVSSPRSNAAAAEALHNRSQTAIPLLVQDPITKEVVLKLPKEVPAVPKPPRKPAPPFAVYNTSPPDHPFRCPFIYPLGWPHGPDGNPLNALKPLFPEVLVPAPPLALEELLKPENQSLAEGFLKQQEATLALYKHTQRVSWEDQFTHPQASRVQSLQNMKDHRENTMKLTVLQQLYNEAQQAVKSPDFYFNMSKLLKYKTQNNIERLECFRLAAAWENFCNERVKRTGRVVLDHVHTLQSNIYRYHLLDIQENAMQKPLLFWCINPMGEFNRIVQADMVNNYSLDELSKFYPHWKKNPPVIKEEPPTLDDLKEDY
jgi:hypothetical protein